MSASRLFSLGFIVKFLPLLLTPHYRCKCGKKNHFLYDFVLIFAEQAKTELTQDNGTKLTLSFGK